MAKHRPRPGTWLRAQRLALGLSLRDVQQASLLLAKKLGNRAFALPASRLHSVETADVVPSIHRLYTLARVYRMPLADLLSRYGIPRS